MESYEIEEDRSFNCSICCCALNNKTRGIFRINRGEGTKPVSDVAWSEMFGGALDNENEDYVVCRQCHRIMEEYGNIETDLMHCRRRLTERFQSARAEMIAPTENGVIDVVELSNSALGDIEELDRLDENVENMVLMSSGRSEEDDLTPLSDMDDSDFDYNEISHLVSPVKKKKKKRKLGKMHCQICQELFENEDILYIKEHYEMHAETNPEVSAKFQHACETCGQRFCTKSKLRTHLLRRHPKDKPVVRSEIHQCPACDAKFDTKKDFIRHVRDHELNDQSVFRCPLCDLSFVNYSRLAKHSSDVHKEDHRCKYGCPETFKSKNEITDHYRHHVEERPHCCEICGLRFENVRSLKQHERTHREGQEEYRCNLCDASFASRTERKQHLQTHGKNCEVCGKNLSSVQTLVDHLRMHHQERKFSCQMCGMLFSSQNALKAHIQRHAGGPKFQCEVCGKVFNYQTNLEAHCRATHMEDATFKCPECPKNYGSLGSLRRHINSVHQLNRKYACNICGQTFLYSSSMLKHRRTHTGERKYPCPVCNKAFSSWDNRYSHMFIHGDKKPFECAVCGQGFPRKHHILTHLKTIHAADLLPDAMEKLIKKNQPNIPGTNMDYSKMQEEMDPMKVETVEFPVVPPGHTILMTKDDGQTYQTMDGQTFVVTTGKHGEVTGAFDPSLDSHTILMQATNLQTTSIKTENGTELLVTHSPGEGPSGVEISSLGAHGHAQQLVPMLMPGTTGEDGEMQQPQYLLIPVS